MPVITTLHTVLREPNPDQRRVMEEIAAISDRLLVMSQLSSQFLQEIFKVSGSKIDMVQHGVPDLPFLDPNFYKDRFGVDGKAVLVTFGLLSPNKGIENVIQALPQILAKHKNVVYIVAGAMGFRKQALPRSKAGLGRRSCVNFCRRERGIPWAGQETAAT
jgi:glycosyltransferase involved in cell wall biosynthesis